jgi:hypothetical protein
MRASFITACLLALAAAAPAITDECEAALQTQLGDGLTAPTADGRPGLGVEFETLFRFNNRNCPRRESDKLKKSLIDNRQGPNFKFTVDTLSEEFKLAPEYIMDGTKIKVGTGDAVRAGRAAAADFVSQENVPNEPLQWI